MVGLIGEPQRRGAGQGCARILGHDQRQQRIARLAVAHAGAALAPQAHHASTEVHVVHVEPGHLGHPRPGAVEHLEQGAVGGLPLLDFKFGCAANAEAFVASRIAQDILHRYHAGEFDVCTIFYNRFQSVISQVPTARQLIPAVFESGSAAGAQYEYEPEEEAILDLYLSALGEI